MKNLVRILGISLLLSACGNESANEEGVKNDTSTTDTTTIIEIESYPINADLAEFIQLFKNDSVLPLKIDTAFLRQSIGKDTLVGKQVKLLTAIFNEHDLTDRGKWDLNSFYTIDSVKAIGQYNEYCEGLDIGNMKYTDVYPIQNLKLNAETILLIWAIKYSTYEACPYASGITVYGTIVHKGEITECFYLGENMSAGDPPVGTDRNVTATIHADKKIELNVYELNDEDMDLPKVEEIKENYVFEIKNGKLELLTEKKEKPKKVKRKN